MRIMKWTTIEELRKMSPEERRLVLKKEIEQSKDMSLDELYSELGKYSISMGSKYI